MPVKFDRRVLMLCAIGSALVLLAMGAAVGSCKHTTTTTDRSTTPRLDSTPETPILDGGTRLLDAAAAQVTPAPPVMPPAPQVKIRLLVRTLPPMKAKIYWGKKLLGVTPLQIDRIRGTEPQDLVVRSMGYFPVHIRAYTMRNETLVVKLTKLEDRMTLFGAKQELQQDPAQPAPLPAAPKPPDDPGLAPPATPPAPAPTVTN